MGGNSFMKCKLCDSEDVQFIHKGVRDRNDIDVYKCNNCTCKFLSTFEHMSEEFYEESGMLDGEVDLELYRLNSKEDDLRRANYLKNKIAGKKVLDFGCGAGGFLHFVNNDTYVANGVELDKSINTALNQEGITCFKNIEEIEGKYDFITLFHVLEHLINPLAILRDLKKHLEPNGVILIEVPHADDALLTLYNHEPFADFTYWSCHLILHTPFTLKKLAEEAQYKVNYVKQIQRYPLSNHLYWLSNDKPGGHKIFNFLNNDILNSEYENILASIGKCDTLLMEISDLY